MRFRSPIKPRTADCSSPREHRCSNVSTSAHMPSQRSHSRSVVSPILSRSRLVLHRGQLPSFVMSVTAVSTARLPQWPQNFEPSDIRPIHAGHAIVLSRERQNWHCVRSLSTADPQFGQFRASIFIGFPIVTFVSSLRAFVLGLSFTTKARSWDYFRIRASNFSRIRLSGPGLPVQISNCFAP